MSLRTCVFYLLSLSLVTTLTVSACTTHKELPPAIAPTAPQQPSSSQTPQGNWAKFVELPNSAEKQTTWYLNYDTYLTHPKNASTRQGRLLIQPYNQATKNVENASSTIEININCYERHYSFGIIRVYSQAYAQGGIIEQSYADKRQHFASAYNPINTGIINFYCKDQ